MDERLEAGRHHLVNGERALDQGYPDDARAYFESAFLQFRGPELRLGEAHAQRGLARVEHALGRDAVAEDLVRAAVRSYRDLLAWLEDHDPAGVSGDMRAQTREGEVAALVLLNEVLVRAGHVPEARAALEEARATAAALGNAGLLADVRVNEGRLALRFGRLAEAQRHFGEALAAHQQDGNPAGEAGVWLLISELHRAQGQLDVARDALDKARPLAEGAHNDRLVGRVLYSLGSLASLQGDLAQARALYDDALPMVREAGDTELEAYLLLGIGEVESRSGQGSPLEDLVDGARMLGAVGHRHGVASALLRIAEHGLRVHEPELALTAAEAARRLWAPIDPVRGVGQALRYVTKALMAMKRWRAGLLTAVTREAIAGASQPNAREVADFYRRRAPRPWVTALEGLPREELARRSELVVKQILEPILRDIEIDEGALGTVGGALEIVEKLDATMPSPAPEPSEEPADELAVPEDTEDRPTEVSGGFLDEYVRKQDLPVGRPPTESPAPQRVRAPGKEDH